MGVVPNINKTSDDVEPSAFGAPVQAGNSQLVGCYLCLMDGNVEQPEIIYHYAGTTYCIDHLYPIVSSQKGQS